MREDGSDAPSWAHPKGVGQERAMVWQPIESAPKDQPVLAWKDGWGPTEAHWEWGDQEDYEGWIATHQDADFYPTHWMPLPPPPSAAGQSLSEPIQDGARTKSPNPEGKKP